MFPAGRYYIGDLCYVLHDRWQEFCNITINGNDVLDGEFTFNDGTKFATFHTAYGDGEYQDNYGNMYPVDAGLIGCILVDDIIKSERNNLDLGNVWNIDRDFTPTSDGGRMIFANVIIDTKFQDYNEYDFTEDNYEEWGYE